MIAEFVASGVKITLLVPTLDGDIYPQKHSLFSAALEFSLVALEDILFIAFKILETI